MRSTTLIVCMAVVGGSYGCTRTRHVSWGVDFASEESRRRAVVLETSVIREGCSGTTLLFFDIAKPGAASAPPSLPKGVYGLKHRARDENCVWYAAGCQNVELPISNASDVTVTLLPTEEEQACIANECVEGECKVGAPVVVSDASTQVPPDADVPGMDSFCSKFSFAPVVLFTFRNPNADGSVDDASPVPPSMQLRPDPARASNVVYSAEGVELKGARLEASIEESRALGETLIRAGSFTVEAWVKPTNASASSLDRIVYYGYDSVGFTLMEKDGFALYSWLRSTATSSNGQTDSGGMSAELAAPMASGAFSHVALSYDAATGTASMYINGIAAASFNHILNNVPASLAAWALQDNRFVLGDIINSKGDLREWIGTLRRVALYDRALSPSDVQTLFQIGKDVDC